MASHLSVLAFSSLRLQPPLPTPSQLPSCKLSLKQVLRLQLPRECQLHLVFNYQTKKKYSITEYTSTVTETPLPGEPQTVIETITAAVGTLTVTDFVQSCETPSPTIGTPSTSSPASTPSATSPVSLNGECGGAGGQTCLGSDFGNCCSGKVQECI